MHFNRKIRSGQYACFCHEACDQLERNELICMFKSQKGKNLAAVIFKVNVIMNHQCEGWVFSVWFLIFCSFSFWATVTRGKKHTNPDALKSLISYLPKKIAASLLLLGSVHILCHSCLPLDTARSSPPHSSEWFRKQQDCVALQKRFVWKSTDKYLVDFILEEVAFFLCLCLLLFALLV